MCPLKLDFYFEIQLCYHRYISNDGNEIYCHKFLVLSLFSLILLSSQIVSLFWFLYASIAGNI